MLDAFNHGQAKNALKGTGWKHYDPPTCSKPMPSPGQPRRNFFRLIRIAKEEGIIDSSPYDTLEKLRLERNTIHAKVLAHHTLSKFYIPKGASYFDAVLKAAAATKAWKAKHP